MFRGRRRIDKTLVLIPLDVRLELEREADRCAPLETGGVLLGFEDTADRRQIQITAMVGPGPKAVHQRNRFEPDSDWQRDQVARIYRESGRVVTYLGDWHSHPRGSTRPSSLDRRTAAHIGACIEARMRHPLMGILAGSRQSWSLATYRFARRRLRPAECYVEGIADASP